MSAEQWSDLFTLLVKGLTGTADTAAEGLELVDSDEEEAVAAAAAAKKAAAAAAALEKQAAAASECFLLQMHSLLTTLSCGAALGTLLVVRVVLNLLISKCSICMCTLFCIHYIE